MKCVRCEICGKRIEVSKLCVPVHIGTQDGRSEHCWCICDECKDHFLTRSHHVLVERQSDFLEAR